MYSRMICVLCSIRYLEVDDHANHIFLYAYLLWAELSRGEWNLDHLHQLFRIPHLEHYPRQNDKSDAHNHLAFRVSKF